MQLQRRFETKEKLGSGTYGDVYKCVEVNSGNIYVLKKLKATTQVTQLLREISIMQRLSKAHPNIVKLVAVDGSGPVPEFVMEKLPLNLLQFLQCFKDLGYVPMTYVKIIVRDILRAVAFLHSRTVAHRDLKPENVLVDLVSRHTGEPIVNPDMSPEQVHQVMCKVHHDLFSAHKSVNRLKRKVEHMKKIIAEKAAKEEVQVVRSPTTTDGSPKSQSGAGANDGEDHSNLSMSSHSYASAGTSRGHPHANTNHQLSTETSNADGFASGGNSNFFDASNQNRAANGGARRVPVVTIIAEDSADLTSANNDSSAMKSATGDDASEGHSSPVNVLKRHKNQRPSDHTQDAKSGSSTPAFENEQLSTADQQNKESVASPPTLPKTAAGGVRRTSSSLSIQPTTLGMPAIADGTQRFDSISPSPQQPRHQRDPSLGLDSQESSMSFHSFAPFSNSTTPTSTGLLSRNSMSNSPSVPTTSLMPPFSVHHHHNASDIASALAAQQAAAEAAALAKEQLREFEKLQYAVAENQHLQGSLAQLSQQYHNLGEMLRQVQSGYAVPNPKVPHQQLTVLDPQTQQFQMSQLQTQIMSVRQQAIVAEEKLQKVKSTIQSMTEGPSRWAADPTLQQYKDMTQELEHQLKRAEEELEKRLANLPIHPIARLCDFGMCRIMLPSDQTAAATTNFYAGVEDDHQNNDQSPDEPRPNLSTISDSDRSPAPSLPFNNTVSYGRSNPMPLPLPPMGGPRISTCAPLPSTVHHDPVLPPRQPTPRVMTVSYRAAEVLMDKPIYGHSIDIWSVGCMIPELITLNILIEYVPLQPNVNVDYGDGLWPNIINLFRVLGVPKTQAEWAAISDPTMTGTLAAEFPKFKSKLKDVGGGKVAAALGEEGMDLLTRMLAFVPEERITAQQALDHPFFADIPRVDLSVHSFYQNRRD